MKAERKEIDFEPIIITIETEEEANYLWHLLNMPANHLEQYVKEWYPTKKSAQKAVEFGKCNKNKIWETFDKIYRPNDMKEDDP